MANNISDIFNKFAGKEVQVVESHQNVTIGGKNYPMTDVWPVANDPTLEEMQKVARDNKLSLRVWFPGTIGTMDYRTDRVNAHVYKAPDGKYRVGSSFNIG